MKTRFFLAAILAALILTACSPAAGQAVKIQSGAYGCQTWYEAALAWVNCSPAGGFTGVVEDHPELGHEYNGRVRVRIEGFGPLWFEPGDVRVVP